ncbi:SNF1-interacting protein [Coniosporium tulheliwenetii]|uniref:SNF1-interacting protein n=1 Tax=Coniosporium tulheliwenetii TaxID=3383036 RepID=A0ACC2ZQ02_9PEZI|nr:SNF1-interacting protein [Cladosporium sp. JES 115]
MGNSSTKESRPSSSLASRPSQSRHVSSQQEASSSSARPPVDRLASGTYTSRRGTPAETRRETKAEREARKLEKERAAREKERERSIREESVDGGFLVTLGTYTGTEDFNKAIVRQLMIERRLAPFWKGLNDHQETWTENQLVAAARGLPIPPADEVPAEEMERSMSQTSSNPRSSDFNINNLTVPINGRSPSSNSDLSMNLSPSHPALSVPSASSPLGSPSSSSPFFRGRAKTLAALSTSSRNNSQTDMTPQEIQLPKDPFVNGLRLEAFLYKDASECPICFLYYPPYLNKTRCCDQPICSECFVQIKRPDPHPPEHHDSNSQPAPSGPHEAANLVSEPAACPFCVQPEFGVTYEPPPFRRGLTYQGRGHHVASAMSAMSSSSSLNSQGAATPAVITTDKVRPDWAKKLSDARAHALRRSAAATALHNAAYVIGNVGGADAGRFALGRRRRSVFVGDGEGSSGAGTPRHGEVTSLAGMSALLAAATERPGGARRATDGAGELFPGRYGFGRSRMEDLEELMMMEAIRLSIAAEEERKRKEEKEAAKEAKKEEKKKAKEAKRAEKAAKRTGYFPPVSPEQAASSSVVAGKGKAVDRTGASDISPLSDVAASSSKDDPQRHLEQSRAQFHSQAGEITSSAPADIPHHRAALRHLSTTSSSASSLAESVPDSLRRGSANGFGASASSFDASPNTSGLNLATPQEGIDTPAVTTPALEPMFNFRSLAAMIGDEEKGNGNTQHIENVAEQHSSSTGVRNRSRGDSGESSSSSRPPPAISLQPPPTNIVGIEGQGQSLDASTVTLQPESSVKNGTLREDEHEIMPLPPMGSAHGDYEQKHMGEFSITSKGRHGGHQATQ